MDTKKATVAVARVAVRLVVSGGNATTGTLAMASAALFLSGCATFGQLDAGLNSLKGQSVDSAFVVLGYPSTQQSFGDRTVYSWVSSSTAVLNSGTSGATVVPLSCTVKLVADPAGTIVGREYEGNLGACSTFIDRLKRPGIVQ